VILIGIVFVVLASGDAAGQAPEVKWRVNYDRAHGSDAPLYGETQLFENTCNSCIGFYNPNRTYIRVSFFFDNETKIDNLTILINNDPFDIIYSPEDNFRKNVNYIDEYSAFSKLLLTNDFSTLGLEDNVSYPVGIKGEYWEDDEQYFFNATENFTYYRTFTLSVSNEGEHTVSYKPLRFIYEITVTTHLDYMRFESITYGSESPVEGSVVFDTGGLFDEGEWMLSFYDIEPGTYRYYGIIKIPPYKKNVEVEDVSIGWVVTALVDEDIKLYNLQIITYDIELGNYYINRYVYHNVFLCPIGFLVMIFGASGIMITRYFKRKRRNEL